jgi:hypothetical protein
MELSRVYHVTTRRSARMLENSEKSCHRRLCCPGGLVVLLQGASGGFHFSLLSILYFVSLFLYWRTVNDALNTNNSSW